MPKNVAIDKADRLAVVVAPALMLFYRVAAPFISVIETSATAITRLLGVKSASPRRYSSEELELYSSVPAGFVTEYAASRRKTSSTACSIWKIFRRAKSRLPRQDIISVRYTAVVDDVLRRHGGKPATRVCLC